MAIQNQPENLNQLNVVSFETNFLRILTALLHQGELKFVNGPISIFDK